MNGPRSTSGTEPARLAVQRATVTLGEQRVLEDVDLIAEAGETVGLIGPNGAGKTTLLRAILGLLRLDSGSVRVAGRPPGGAAGVVGYVPQKHDFAWDFPITVLGAVLNARTPVVGLLRRFSKADRAAAADALARVELTDRGDRPIGELSGGMRQRVLVARALVRRPGLLLLDEPFTGVDVPTQELLVGILAELASEGTAIVMTTHDLSQAEETCSRICLLNRTVIADGPPTELTEPTLWLRAFGVGTPDRLGRFLDTGSKGTAAGAGARP